MYVSGLVAFFSFAEVLPSRRLRRNFSVKHRSLSCSPHSPFFFLYCYYYDPVALPASGLSLSLPFKAFNLRYVCLDISRSPSVSLALPAHESMPQASRMKVALCLYTCTTSFLRSFFSIFPFFRDIRTSTRTVLCHHVSLIRYSVYD